MSEMFPPGSGALIRAALGADPEPGPPYTHVHRLPETEEEMAAEPFLPKFTVESVSEISDGATDRECEPDA